MPKYKVKIYEAPYIYTVDAKNEGEAEAQVLRAAGYEHDSSEITVEVECEKE